MRTIIKKIVSVAGMARFAKDLAKKYVYQPVNNHSREWLSKRSGALVIALEGELGAGKTTLTKAFLKTLGVRENVTSPTFILFRPYVLKDKSSQLKAYSFTLAYHIDCYRLENPKELLKLGLKDMLKNPNYIVIIEWAERVKKFLPKNAVWISIKHGATKNQRTVIVKV